MHTIQKILHNKSHKKEEKPTLFEKNARRSDVYKENTHTKPGIHVYLIVEDKNRKKGCTY